MKILAILFGSLGTFFSSHPVFPSGIRLLGAGQTDMAEARALSHDNDIIDIYSNSWGPPDFGFVAWGPGRMAERTFMEGVCKVYLI